MHAEDTVLYTQGKDLDMIEKALSRDISSLAAWFHENEPLINLKKGKTEDMLGSELQRG